MYEADEEAASKLFKNYIFSDFKNDQTKLNDLNAN